MGARVVPLVRKIPDLYHSTALVKVAKSLVPLNVIGHGKVLN